MDKNQLYYGDNLDVLRRYIKDESVDLIYLDPPFNSRQDYNVLFAEKDGTHAASQIKAFEDTWEWNQEAERTYEELVEQGGQVADVMRAFRTFLKGSDMMAYLAMMAPRLMELRRVLKVTGSIYLHCDPTASHYLKMLMDAVFGPVFFRNEIIWKRTNARSTTAQWPRVHDVLLFFSSTDSFRFQSQKAPADKAKLPHTLITGTDGKKYQTYELTGPGATKGESGQPWRGFDVSGMGRHWANGHAVMDGWDKAGLIHWPSDGGFPRRRDSEPFDPDARTITVADVWTDIDRINQAAQERLGYPTQKPEALLDRIIRASSNEGDIVLDPFCGCGTAVVVAQRLRRRWIGIDITHLAINLIKKRLSDAIGLDVKSTYDVIGEPTALPDAEVLAKEDPYQFQWWALSLLGARPYEQKKGSDRGIDGRLYVHDDRSGRTKQIILSVKAGHVQVSHVRDLRGTSEREKAEIGVLICLEKPTKPMLHEAVEAGFYEAERWGKFPRIQILTIEELLAGKTIDYPRGAADATFKRAPKAKHLTAGNLNLPLK